MKYKVHIGVRNGGLKLRGGGKNPKFKSQIHISNKINKLIFSYKNKNKKSE